MVINDLEFYKKTVFISNPLLFETKIWIRLWAYKIKVKKKK